MNNVDYAATYTRAIEHIVLGEEAELAFTYGLRNDEAPPRRDDYPGVCWTPAAWRRFKDAYRDARAMRRAAQHLPQPPAARRDHVRVKPYERGAVQAADGHWYMSRTDALAASRAQRRFWAHRNTGLHYFVTATGEVVQAEETDQPHAPRSMRVRTCRDRLCVSIGFWSRADVEAGKARDYISTGQAEAAALEARGYRVRHDTWRAHEFGRALSRASHRAGRRTVQVAEAHLLHGIPLLSAARHLLRADEDPPPEKRVQNLVRQAQRLIRSLDTHRRESVGHPTGCGDATLTAAATGRWSNPEG